MKIGVPAGVQGMIFSFANIIIQSAVNSLGTTVMAASSAAYNLEIFAYYIMNSFGQACTTFVGQNYGAGKGERCRRVLKLCLLQSLFSTAAASGLILLFSCQSVPLEAQLKEAIKDKKAEIGIAVIIDGKDTITVNNDNHYPLMSVFKFHQAFGTG